MSSAMFVIAVRAVRYFLWAHGGERILSACLYMLGHALHWKQRHIWLNQHGPLQSLQRGVAAIAFVVGSVYAITGKGKSASPLADLIDTVPTHFYLVPHQIFGLILATSSVLLIVAIYEWPMEGEEYGLSQIADSVSDGRLLSLLRMSLFGHMMALAYWGLTGLYLVYSCSTSAGGWGSLVFCTIHCHLYIRNNREYEKEKGALRRAQILSVTKPGASPAFAYSSSVAKVLTGQVDRDIMANPH